MLKLPHPDQGDFHNFGKKVVFDDNLFFIKPRSVFWEQFFFSQNSPLFQIFKTFSFHEFHFPSLCQLEIQSFHEWSGSSKRISKENLNQEVQAWGFGSLLAYAYVFGLYDLHRENCIPTLNGLQVIDLEMAFGAMILPHESLLLPFKDFDAKMSALQLLQDENLVIDDDFTEKNIASFVSFLEFTEIHRLQIEKALSETNFSQVPNRLIFRDSKKYSNYLHSKEPIDDLIPEEIEQLNRKDLPYFFRYENDPAVYYWQHEDHQKAIAKIPDSFLPLLKRFPCKKYVEIFQGREILRALIPHGVLYLAYFFKPQRTLTFSKHSKLEKIGQNKYKFKFQDSVFLS